MKEDKSKIKNYTKYSNVYSHNIDTKTHLVRMKKRGKKVHKDTKEQNCKRKEEQICREKKEK